MGYFTTGINFICYVLKNEIDTLVSDVKLLNSNNWSWGSNKKLQLKSMIRGPQPICRHPLNFAVTIAFRTLSEIWQPWARSTACGRTSTPTWGSVSSWSTGLRRAVHPCCRVHKVQYSTINNICQLLVILSDNFYHIYLDVILTLAINGFPFLP